MVQGKVKPTCDDPLQEVTAHKATKKELAAAKSDLPKAQALKSELQKREKQIATLRSEHSVLKTTLQKQKKEPVAAVAGGGHDSLMVGIRLHDTGKKYTTTTQYGSAYLNQCVVCAGCRAAGSEKW